MWYLKSQGYIDDIVFAIFTDLDKVEGDNKPKSHISLGKFDSQDDTLKDGQNMKWINTKDLNSWSVLINSAKFVMPDQNKTVLADTFTRFIDFYPNLPWIYIPTKDF